MEEKDEQNTQPCCCQCSAPDSGAEATEQERQELEEYAKSVRTRIELGMGGLFPNKSHKYTTIIIKEFLKAARDHAYIFCGRLAKDVYAPCLTEFREAIDRGVDVRVITSLPVEKVEARDLATLLIENDALRYDKDEDKDVSHFMEMDGKMFRLEINPETREAFVCASARKNERERRMVDRITALFNLLWLFSAPARLA